MEVIPSMVQLLFTVGFSTWYCPDKAIIGIRPPALERFQAPMNLLNVLNDNDRYRPVWSVEVGFSGSPDILKEGAQNAPALGRENARFKSGHVVESVIGQ